MDSQLLPRYHSPKRRGKPWPIVLSVFLCFSILISLPLLGVYGIFALLKSESSTSGILDSLKAYDLLVLVLIVVGFVAEFGWPRCETA